MHLIKPSLYFNGQKGRQVRNQVFKSKKKTKHKENVKVCVSCASPPVEKRQQINKIVKAKSSESLEKVGFEA